ncbi:MAG: hypothetical protein Q9221_002796 [Calogaya cf. arnoldii]
MAPHGPWEVTVGCPEQIPTETSFIWTCFTKPFGEGGFIVVLDTSAPGSSFTYTGQVSGYGPPTTTYCIDLFNIRGTGSISKEGDTGVERFVGTFEVVAGSGENGFEGVSGGGKIKLEYKLSDKEDDDEDEERYLYQKFSTCLSQHRPVSPKMVGTRRILYQPSPVKPWTVIGVNSENEGFSYMVVLLDRDRDLHSATTLSGKFQFNIKWNEADLSLTGECIRLGRYAKLFRIQGNYREESKGFSSVLNMSFEILPGSGVEDYERIRGGGTIVIELLEGTSIRGGNGRRPFENMNQVGLPLE